MRQQLAEKDPCDEAYLLTKNHIRCKVQIFTSDILKGAPTQGEHHQVHPRVLDEGHLIGDLKIAKPFERKYNSALEHGVFL